MLMFQNQSYHVDVFIFDTANWRSSFYCCEEAISINSHCNFQVFVEEIASNVGFRSLRYLHEGMLSLLNFVVSS